MIAMREIPPQEIKDFCEECLGAGVKYFNNIDKLLEYIERKQIYFDQHLAVINQYVDDGYIDCPVCGNKGYITRRI